MSPDKGIPLRPFGRLNSFFRSNTSNIAGIGLVPNGGTSKPSLANLFPSPLESKDLTYRNEQQ